MAFVALVIACFTAKPLLGNLDQAFQYIQEYTGFFSPGILAIFIFGLFWKKSTANAALLSAILSFPFSLLIKIYLPEVPFMNRMGIVFLLCAGALVLISYLEGKGKDHMKAINIEKGLFKTSAGFNVGAIVISIVLAIIYTSLY